MTVIPGFKGRVVATRDPDYDEVRRVWNGAIDRRPALIARCTDAEDVVAAVRHARERDLPLAVRGGGHQVSGHSLCDGGLVVDCSPMKGIEVDPGRRAAHAGSGVLWGELDAATQEYGLATTGGVVTHTGIAGLTLGGGIGWLMRRHGLTADNLLGVEVVSADGRVRVADADTDPDLYWAVRGGGGNFGVVTSFRYRLHAVGPTVLGGLLLWPLERAGEVIRFYRDFLRDVPDEFMSILNLRLTAPLAPIPAHLHGTPACIVALCWAGDLAAGERVIEPLRRFGPPLVDLVRAMPYVEHQAMFDPAVPHGRCWHWKTCELADLDDAVVDALVEHSVRITSPVSYTVVFQLGGAVGRVPEEDTAYAHRDAAHNVNINAGWLPGDARHAEHIAWARDFHAALEPFQAGVYVNFLADEGEERVRAAYGAAKYARLAELKRRYDPDNVFRRNHNIRPAPAGR